MQLIAIRSTLVSYSVFPLLGKLRQQHPLVGKLRQQNMKKKGNKTLKIKPNLKFKLQPYRTMIRTCDFRINKGSLYIFPEIFTDKEIVKPPANILFARIGPH